MNTLFSPFWKALLRELAFAAAASIVTELAIIGVDKAVEAYTAHKGSKKSRKRK